MTNNKGFKFCVIVCEPRSSDAVGDFSWDGKQYSFFEFHPCRDAEDMKSAYIRIRQKYKASKRFKVISTHLLAIDAITSAIGFAEVSRHVQNYEDRKQQLQKGATANDNPI